MQTLASHLGAILTSLRAVIAAVAHRERVHAAALVLAWGHIGRAARRFECLFLRWCNGTLPKPRGPRATPRAARVRATTPRLPRAHGWMFYLDSEIRTCGSQFNHFLATHPDLPAFLAAAPQAGRILRPLCRLLLITPPPLLALPGEAARKPPPLRAPPLRAPRLRAPRPPPPVPQPTPAPRPSPRYVPDVFSRT